MAYIGNSLAQGLISGANIQDGTVDTPDLKASAVTTAKLADASVTLPKLDFTAGIANTIPYLNGSKVLTTSSALTFDGDNLTFNGTTAPRLLVNMSGTQSTRFAIQNSTANGNTRIFMYPAVGTGNISAINGRNSTDSTNFSAFDLAVIGSTDVRLSADYSGTGTALPITFYTSAAERVRIDNIGNVGIGTNTPSTITGAVATLSLGGTNASVSGGIAYQVNGTVKAFHYVDSDGLFAHQAITGGIKFLTTNTERMRIDSAGKVSIGLSGPTSGALNISAGGAVGVSWHSGLNIGDSTNYCGFIQDGGISRWRNIGSGGYQFFNAAGNTSLLTIANNGDLTNSGGNNILHSGNSSSYLSRAMNTNPMVGYDAALPANGYECQAFLVSGAGAQPTGGDGCVIAWTWSSANTYGSQIYVDIDPTNYFAVRTRNSAGVWQSWRNF